MTSIVCPRCGHADTFIKGYLPETCVCRMCQSQLDWREIPGMGPDCKPKTEGSAAAGEMPASPASDDPTASGKSGQA